MLLATWRCGMTVRNPELSDHRHPAPDDERILVLDGDPGPPDEFLGS